MSQTANRFKVFVQPRASRSSVTGMHGDALRIRLTAPPVGGAANDALVAYVAGQLGVAPRCVRIVAGHSSRRKMIEIDGMTAERAVASLLGR